MSHTISRSATPTACTVLRLAYIPALGALAGSILAVLVILAVRAAEAAIGYSEHVSVAALAIVPITYAPVGAMVARILFPHSPRAGT